MGCDEERGVAAELGSRAVGAARGSPAAEESSAQTLKCVSRLLLEIDSGREGSPGARLSSL